MSQYKGQVNKHGLKWVFLSMYRPSCLIEAYEPEKYWLVCVGLLAAHLFNLNFIFLSNGPAVAE